MRKLIALSVAAGVALSATASLAQTANDVFGNWADAETGGALEVFKCGQALCAKISKVPPGKEAAKDVNNENPALRDRLLLGLVIVENAVLSDDTTWSGVIYDRERGKSFDATLRAKDKNTLEITGCKLAILCKTRTMVREK